MNKPTLLGLLIFICTPYLHAEKYIIKVSESILLPIHAKQKISINGSRYIKWIDKGRNLKVIGQVEGLVEIKTLAKNYEIQIISKKKYNIYIKYKKLLSSLRGLEIDFIDNTPAIKGNLYRFKDWEKINTITNKHQIYYLMNAVIDDDVRDIAIRKFKPLLFQYSQLMPEIKLIPYPTIYRLKNSSSDDFDHIFKLMGFRIKEKINSNISKQIRMTLNFIEVSKAKSSNLGLTWLGGFQAKVYPNYIDNSSIDALLNQSSSDGDTNIIYKTQIVCEINQECQFSEGGQFPVRTSGYINSSITWKNYGLVLKFTPNLLANERVKIKLQYDLSHIDSQGDGEVPAIKSKTMLTYVNTKNNMPIVVTGLENSISRNSGNGPFPIKQIPLLNKIFTNNTTNKSETKMLLVITPSLLDESE